MKKIFGAAEHVPLKQSEILAEEEKPQCPYCKSTNIRSISKRNRIASIIMWGVFSHKIDAKFECKDCGFTW